MERKRKRPPRGRAEDDYVFQRAYKACIPCARRKVKCEPSGRDGACSRCSKKKIDCTFDTKKPWSRNQNGPPADGTTSRDEAGPQPGHHQPEEAMENHSEDDQVDGLPTSVLQNTLSTGNDAMNILFEAAPQEKSSSISPSGSRQADTPKQTLGQFTSPDVDVLRVWNACRFVKMGWFTAQEAMILVDLFFENMSPHSPVLTDFYAFHTNQFWLVTQEPMLCCIILMISSRYHTLPGIGGPSRAFSIHHRLWQHCQHLLLRVMLGQEKFSKAKTRNIGTIEALILLSEWYPRALQFPPDNDGWDSDLILTMPIARDPPSLAETLMSSRWREDVVEPTKRFERMSWMALNSALALAHELGIFDSNPQSQRRHDPEATAGVYNEHLKIRRQRLPSLLYIYVNLLSSRIGCTSPMPHLEPFTPGRTSMDNFVDRQWLSFMSSWIDLTNLSTSITNQLAPARDSIVIDDTDTFMSDLEQKQLLLSNWKRENLDDVPIPFKDILFIEYNHLRILTNSIGMQRIVRQVLSKNHSHGSTINHSFISQARQLNMTGREYGFIEEVLDGCCQTLEKVTSLSSNRPLQYLPMRVLFRTITSSIFLMKALALGVRCGKLQDALQILDGAVTALENDKEDDFHLKSQYAALLRILVSRLRSSLLSSYSESAMPSAQSERNDASNMAGMDIPSFDDPGVHDPTADLQLDNLANINLDDWLSLPLDASMAPFRSSEENIGLGLDGVDLDLSFMWQLSP